MKVRLIWTLIVLVILGVLAYVVEPGLFSGSSPSHSSSSSEF